MKKLLALTILALFTGLTGAFEAAAQNADAKDLYTQYGNNSTAGSMGAKISVLLKRANQAERIASIDETFYSGDRIKLVLDINFAGFVAVLNNGSSGRKNLLFPYFDAARRLVSHGVSANAGTQIPRGNDWIVFDDKAGKEQVTVIFSKSPLVELQKYERTSKTAAIDGEVESVLGELSDKSLAEGKDLFTQTNSDAAYYVVKNGLGDKMFAFTFFLKHS